MPTPPYTSPSRPKYGFQFQLGDMFVSNFTLSSPNRPKSLSNNGRERGVGWAGFPREEAEDGVEEVGIGWSFWEKGGWATTEEWLRGGGSSGGREFWIR
ncbi:unnamed protein product [Prunus armeniaca]|uniref:Uncharacterized protein n=1 Tax=Prunus armeniaca TaxID=36596 RepID=A0A6J5TDL5_PRUAR|nr:unnamed protein product [Prunus armeniaca]